MVCGFVLFSMFLKMIFQILRPTSGSGKTQYLVEEVFSVIEIGMLPESAIGRLQ